MAKLTAKQEMFCKEYLIDLNATQAAIRAEYSEKTAQQVGSENLSKPVIAEYIQELFDARANKVDVSAEWVLTSLKSVANRCMQEEQVMTKDGPTGEYKFDSSGANKSLELIGKHLKLFTEKLEVDTTVQIKEIQRKIV